MVAKRASRTPRQHVHASSQTSAVSLPLASASETGPANRVEDVDPPPPLVPAARVQPEIFAELLQHGFSEDELFALVIPKRTLARRRAGHEVLTVEETDKAMRLMRIAMQAQRVFGEPGKAHRWLRRPKRELSGQTPLIFLSSEAGARVVEEMLHRIEHGIFA
jgi:putative toxin-antitoxin system antitoxin component (TIGR02293 family)